MKLYFHVAAGLCSLSCAAFAQNYQTQYPYDPYSGSPQPQVQQPQSSGYQTYNSSSNDYGKGSYGYGSESSGGTISDYSRLLTWGQLEAHYAYNDFRGDDRLEGDSGFGANLRVKLMKPIYLHLGLDRITSSDPHAHSLEITSFCAGAGVYLPIGQRFQIYGEVGLRYDYTSGDLEYLNPDDLSVYVRPGVRFAATDKLELTASVLFNDTDNLNDFVIEVSGYYSLLSWLDVGAGVDFGSDINTYRIGGRWRWD
jgi:hypothetical protein